MFLWAWEKCRGFITSGVTTNTVKITAITMFTQNNQRKNVKYDATTEPKCDSISLIRNCHGMNTVEILINSRRTWFHFYKKKIIYYEMHRNFFFQLTSVSMCALTTAKTILNRAHKSFVLLDIANRSCNAPSCRAMYSLA